MLYTAQRDGDWRDAATWGTPTARGSTDQVAIHTIISVSISGAAKEAAAIVHSSSTIDISDTLSHKLVSTYTAVMPPSGLVLYSGAALTTEKSGTLAISATGSPNLNAHAVLL